MDGSSWTTVSTPFDGQRSTFFRDVDGSASDDVWIVGYINYSITIALHWDGNSMTQVPGPPSEAPFQKVAVLAPDDAWATPYSLTAGNVFFHWDGNLWSETAPIELPEATTVSWRGLAKAGPCDVWAVGSYSIDTTHHTLVARLQPGEVTVEPIIYVGDVSVSRVQVAKKSFQGEAVVTVIDSDRNLIAGAAVTGTFSGPTAETLTVATGPDGKATFASSVVGRTRDTWCFIVDEVAAVGTVYNAALNEESSDCEQIRRKKTAAVSSSLDAYPSPFNPKTTFSFALVEEQAVSLEVYDLTGRRVARLIDGVLPAGQHAVPWDASSLPSGVYLYRLAAGLEVATGRVTLLK